MKRLLKRDESGMTLIELLIAIAISGIVLAGVIQVLTTSTSSYSRQEEMAAMQQNVRMAKMFLERDCRMAGCGLPDNPVIFTNGGASGTDILTINYTGSDTSCDNILPQLTLSAEPPSSSNANVNEDFGSTPYSAWTGSIICGNQTYGNVPPFREFMALITSPDGSLSDVVYITQIPGSKKLQNRPYGFPNKILNSYPIGSTINFLGDNSLSTITYSYSNGSLIRQVNTDPGEAIADNIEDLQFAFGLDTNNDGTVDSWINNRDLSSNEIACQLRLIRINVLGRTSHEHPGQPNTRPAIEDHVAGTIQDKYGRQLFQITAMLRNLKYNPTSEKYFPLTGTPICP